MATEKSEKSAPLSPASVFRLRARSIAVSGARRQDPKKRKSLATVAIRLARNNLCTYRITRDLDPALETAGGVRDDALLYSLI